MSTANSCRYTGRQWIEPEECQAAGCCYLPGPSAIGAANAPLLLPPCFWPNTGASSYALTNGRLDAAVGATPRVPRAGHALPSWARNLLLDLATLASMSSRWGCRQFAARPAHAAARHPARAGRRHHAPDSRCGERVAEHAAHKDRRPGALGGAPFSVQDGQHYPWCAQLPPTLARKHAACGQSSTLQALAEGWLRRLKPPAPPAEDPLSGGPAIYNLSVSSSPFGFAVARAGAAPGDAPLFNTAGHRFIFKVMHRAGHALLALAQELTAAAAVQDQYLELTTALPESAAIYGLGERTPSNGVPRSARLAAPHTPARMRHARACTQASSCGATDCRWHCGTAM